MRSRHTPALPQLSGLAGLVTLCGMLRCCRIMDKSHVHKSGRPSLTRCGNRLDYDACFLDRGLLGYGEHAAPAQVSSWPACSVGALSTSGLLCGPCSAIATPGIKMKQDELVRAFVCSPCFRIEARPNFFVSRCKHCLISFLKVAVYVPLVKVRRIQMCSE